MQILRRPVFPAGPLFLAALLLLPLSAPLAASGGVVSSSIRIQVYADGSAFMAQNITVGQSAASVKVTLLSTVFSGVLVTDGKGAPLEYSLTGANITIYTLGSNFAFLKYDSLDLTEKIGTVWTISFSAGYNTTLVLPVGSTVLSVSGTPNSLDVRGGAPVMSLSPGKWQVKYGVSIGTTTGIQTTSGSGSGTGVVWSGVYPYAAAATLLAVVGLILLYFLRRRGGQGARGNDLRPDDLQVLDFISEKGGKVLEPEIRMKFALPKTSAWRQIKRLERLGYVKVSKIGSQNQIELLKKREGGV